MRFLLDKPLSWRLCRFLRRVGHDCLHVDSAEMGQAMDRAIWEFAKAEQRILITKDLDHFNLACRANEQGRLVWLRCGNVSHRETEETLKNRLDEIIARFEAGERIIQIE